MAKVKKMADGGMAGLGQLLGGGTLQKTRMPSELLGMSGRIASPIGGGGGGGSAEDGINQINSGAQTVSGAIGSAQSALGGSSGAIPQAQATFKKGGSVGKTATKVTTASKNKTTPNW